MPKYLWEDPVRSKFLRGGSRSSSLSSIVLDGRVAQPVAVVALQPILEATSSQDIQASLSPEAKSALQAAWPIAARKVCNIPWHEHEDLLRRAALTRWRLIRTETIACSGLGRLLMHDHLALQSLDTVENTIRDVFAKKGDKNLVQESR